MSAQLGVGILGAGPVTQAIHLPTLARMPDLFRVTAPSLVLMDATLRPIPFSEMTERMLGFDPAARIIGVTNIFEGRRACQLLSYGAKGHIARTMSPETIIRIIRLVAQGETVIEADLSE